MRGWGGRRCYVPERMPELPEVEIARRNLVRWFDGRRLVRAEADDTRVFRGAERGAFARLHGRLESLVRRGKYLLFAFEEGRGLLGHLGMTGKFVRRSEADVVPYSRARFHLDNGQVLHFADARMFGRMEPAPSSELRSLDVVKALGRDPLADGLTAGQLAEAVASSKQDLKVALMDQARIAGLGNIHAAEALFRAGLHPARKPSTLTPDDWKRLVQAIRASIDFGLEEQAGEEPVYLEDGGAENLFLVYGRGGGPCSKCASPVESFTQAGRTTYACPKCQPRGRTGK